ncbi:MAG: homoserine O-acetyltransferase [Meiothermus sp.]|uniref:homoserine O-acetyltransferase MetX n=1 Tax=Meiothermus sp. TaxID=1955249 RepID=UPI0025E9908C|nr:homoserine O-acetyltransferase [Meiothermus sp.]MCS7059103.1 homoserine O-acetyltransferase [Meiothermus sp.]MCS7195525.1 homoserine O-acetyltransferase [Meiothermus sp.]MCX7741317.1 homoserine O-acetyltransferase [Meiothermus sp.]MDW8090453.1 homoserine O-acetyltransferase [Meiothermus sp.]MDW8481046.1 homoserine O-acetyltransferase [Meiothermus sp.]
MTDLIQEAWGDHEALLIKPPKSRGRVPPPVPAEARVATEFRLEHGDVLPEVVLRYETYGRLNSSRSNAVLVFHAWTGSAHLAGTYTPETLRSLPELDQAFGPEGWWDELAGPGRMLDTDRYFVLCANHIGSCYGSTGPLSHNPRTGRPYGPDFPKLTVRDLAKAQARLLDFLGIERVSLLGGSLGGMVALEFALMFPERVNKLVVLAAPAVHGPWARAFNRLSREAVRADPAYRNGYYTEQPFGLQLGRAIAMLSFRSPASFRLRWQAHPERGESYVLYQGEKFARRFDANAYLVLSEAMDTHDVGRGRGGVEAALRRLRGIPSLFVGIDTDLLYTAAEVREAALLAGGQYREIRSPHGHDAFLIETDQVEAILGDFL